MQCLQPTAPAGAFVRVIRSVDPALPCGLQVVVPPTGGVIGRQPDAPICLAGQTVSRAHAELRPAEGGTWTLTPLTSSNATFAGGVPIGEPTALRLGDTFQVGGVACALESDGGTAPVHEPLLSDALLELHDDAGSIVCYSRGRLLPIRGQPARLLDTLAAATGRPVHRWDLHDALGESAAIDKVVSHLRRGLRDAMVEGLLDAGAVAAATSQRTDDPTVLVRALVVTRRGHGYLLALDPRHVHRYAP